MHVPYVETNTDGVHRVGPACCAFVRERHARKPRPFDERAIGPEHAIQVHLDGLVQVADDEPDKHGAYGLTLGRERGPDEHDVCSRLQRR